MRSEAFCRSALAAAMDPRSNAPTRLLLQSRWKVRNHGDRLVDLLRNHIQKDSFVVRRNIEDELLGGGGRDQRLRGAELQCTIGFLHGHDRQYAADVVGEVEFLSVFAPLWLGALVGRNLPFALPAA